MKKILTFSCLMIFSFCNVFSQNNSQPIYPILIHHKSANQKSEKNDDGPLKVKSHNSFSIYSQGGVDYVTINGYNVPCRMTMESSFKEIYCMLEADYINGCGEHIIEYSYAYRFEVFYNSKYEIIKVIGVWPDKTKTYYK